jgi:hypothetical protein
LPRYFFDVRSRFGRDEDLEGSELPSMDAALDEALDMAGRLQDLWSGVPPESQKDIAIEIVDEAGLTVMTLPFWQIEKARRLELFHKTRLEWLYHSKESGEAASA